MTINERNAPYHDDYDEDKLFLKMLFKPTNAVQVRELNQLQTYLQKQISRFGDHLFKDGSMVVPGEVNYDLKYPYVKLELADAYQDVAATILSPGVTANGADGLIADVMDLVDVEGTDPITLYVKYQGSGTTGESKAFVDAGIITFKDALGNDITTATVTETGFGSKASVNRGIYYISGKFVLVTAQDVIVSKYTVTPSKKVGLSFVEEVVTSFEDETLLDNALGSPNYTAPGADRYKLTATLVAVDSGSEPDSFIELITLDAGAIESIIDDSQYAILADTLARRTFDQSGDFTVDPFKIVLQEHPTDATKIQVGLEPGKAYVRGYEAETTSTRYLNVNRARDTKLFNNSVTIGEFGNYVVANTIYGLPDVAVCDEIEFYDGAVTVPGSTPAGTKVATARVRHVELVSTTQAKLYLFGLSGSPTAAISVYAPDVYTPFTGMLVTDASGSVMYESNSGAYIFESALSNVKTLLDGAGNTDTSFVVMRKYDVQSDSSANVVLTAGTDELFGEYSLTNYALTTDSGEIVDLTGKVTRGGAVTGQQVTIALGVGYETTNVRVVVAVIKQIAEQKTKTAQTQVMATQSLTLGALTLNKADVYALTSVVDDTSAQDITDSFVLDSGQKRGYYGLGSIRLKAGHPAPSTTVTVTFEYFYHSPGDYFSVDSYSSIDYGNIPSFTDGTKTYRLSDCFDFRPRINDAGTGFSGAGSSVGQMLKPAAYITSDVTTYLPRIDKVFIDYRGEFGVVEGTSDIEPKEPSSPNDSMVLYKLVLNPYTFDEKDLQISYVENKRYTMRDIGKLENRIENLEYYTVLNALEKKTADQQVIDPVTGNDRFKNGFFADPFTDHNIGDFLSSEVRCSIDQAEGVLRAEFDAQGIDLEFDVAASTNVEQHGDLITLPYLDQSFIKQSQATRTVNVNPYDVFTWAGRADLSPSSDFWVDTRYKDPVITFIDNGKRTTNTWRSWAIGWSGARVVEVTQNQNRERFGIIRWGGTSSTTITNVVEDRLVSNEIIPWMRPRAVAFKARKMKPSTRLYPYFDGVLVTSYCQPSGGALGGALITNAAGELNGTFRIPAGTFRTGTKEFKLLDNATGDEVEALTSAADTYTAKGILSTRQRSIVSTKQTQTVRWVDPLAQSFLVDIPGGAFITKIKLFFETKDDNIPVTVDIREMENGQPTGTIVPYSEVVKASADVNVSSDASLGTDFVFESPVFLQEGQEYCFVISADSNRYNVWVAAMGEQDVVSGKWISKQPYIGVMFKSQNSSTWTASQMEDIKFELFRAQFTSTTGTVSLKNTDIEALPLPSQPFLATSGSSVLVVNHPYHGMMSGSLVTYSDATGGAGITDVELNTTHTVVDVLDVDTYTIDVTTLATSSTLMGGDVMTASNIQFSTLRPLVRDMVLSGTSMAWGMNGTTGQSISGTETPYQAVSANLINSEDIHFQSPLVVLNAEEEAAQLAGRSFELVASLSTNRNNLSPVIDTNRLGAIAVRNRINSPATLDETYASSDDAPRSDRAACRYINKAVTLDAPASILKVWFDVQKTATSDVKVMYRVLGADSGEDLSAIDWVEMDAVKYATPSGSLVFYEEEHEKEFASPFIEFQVKLVPISSSEGSIPQVKNLRALALS